MKYFRHTPLLGWTFICLTMIGVLVASLMVGKEKGPIRNVVANKQAAITDVYTLRTRLSDLNRVATPPASTLPEWSRETSRIAGEAAKRRLDEGVSKEDGLVRVLETMQTDADNLSKANPSDVSAVRAGVALLFADGDALSSILAGVDGNKVKPLPGEENPIISTDPTDSDPLNPDPAAPEDGTLNPPTAPKVPAVPVQPIKPGTPQIPVVPISPLDSNALDSNVSENPTGGNQ